MPFDADTFKHELDSLGYDEVHLKLSTDKTWYDYEPRRGLAQDWLRRASEAKASALAERHEAREERMLAISERSVAISDSALSIAKEDLSAARSSSAAAQEQARWAKWAAIAAVITLMISKADDISKLFP